MPRVDLHPRRPADVHDGAVRDPVGAQAQHRGRGWRGRRRRGRRRRRWRTRSARRRCSTASARRSGRSSRDDAKKLRLDELYRLLDQIRRNGEGEKGNAAVERTGADGTDPEVTRIRDGERAGLGGRATFDAGSAKLDDDARAALAQVAGVLRGRRNVVLVKGHTALDDVAGDPDAPAEWGAPAAPRPVPGPRLRRRRGADRGGRGPRGAPECRRAARTSRSAAAPTPTPTAA